MGGVIRKTESTVKILISSKNVIETDFSSYVLVVTLFEQTASTIILFWELTHTTGKKSKPDLDRSVLAPVHKTSIAKHNFFIEKIWG